MSNINEWSGDDARRAELKSFVAAAKAIGAIGIELTRADYDRVSALLGIQEKIVSETNDVAVMDTHFFEYDGIKFKTQIMFLTR